MPATLEIYDATRVGKRPLFTTHEELLEESSCDEQAPEKKRRLTAEQVQLLERSFEEDNKLEPQRKTELARRLGMPPRQVAVWFRNRRARWKTKQLERDYGRLRASYDALRADNDSLRAQRMGMQSQSASLPWSYVGDSRMDDMYTELDALECAVDGSKKPCNLKFSFLQFITKQFSDELKIGHGGCGLVYKGILPNRVIAVKKLLNNHTIDDKMFHQEVTSLMMVAHKNTVRLLGYCSHTEEKAIDVAGKIIMAEIRERLLCFEYVTNGSLENHITDELRGLEWYTRYQIIKGICEGLHHLHKEKHIIHLDLKPANILLDDDMVPKISDFGLSRLDEKSHTLSAERLLTLGYCAPEYLQRGKRSAKSDIYSLGVILTELVTGSRGNPCITKVLRRWKHRWNKSAIDTQLWFKQVSTCLDLLLRCKHTDPTDRPNIWDIITDLNKMDNADARINNDTECLKLENMLDIEPLEMHFPFELNKHIPGSIELTNDADDYFTFRMSSISVRPYFIHPFKGIVPPRSKCSVTILLQPQERVPPQFPCKDEFSVQSTRVDMNLKALDITEDMFHEELGKVVDEVTLKVVLDSPSPPDNIRADSIGTAGSVPLTFSPISSTLGQILQAG